MSWCKWARIWEDGSSKLAHMKPTPLEWIPSTFERVCPYSHYNLVGERPTRKLNSCTPTPSLKVAMTNFIKVQLRITSANRMARFLSQPVAINVYSRSFKVLTMTCPSLAGMITLKFDANWTCFWWRISLHKLPAVWTWRTWLSY